MALDNPIDTALSSRVTQILSGADALLPDPTSPAMQAANASVPAGDLLAALSDDASNDSPASVLSNVTDLANSTVLGFHQSLEATADQNGLIGAVHGLTNLGETVGLGKIGQTNLVTEALTAPAALVSGDTSVLNQTVPNATAVANAATGLVEGAASDAGLASNLVPSADTVTNLLHSLSAQPVDSLAGAATNVVDGVVGDLSSGVLLSNPVGELQHILSLSGDSPLGSLLNQTVDALAPTLSAVGGTLLPDTIGGLLNVTHSIGLGDIGGQNLLTDLGHLPSGLLSGDTTSLTDLPGDLAAVTSAVGSTLGGLGMDVSTSSLLGSLTHLTTGAGILGGSLPGQGLTSGLISQIEGVLNDVGTGTGSVPLTQAATAAVDGLLGNGSTTLGGLLHDVGTQADLGSSAPGDLGSTIGSLGNIASAASGEGGLNGLLAQVAGPLAGISGASGTGGSSPLAGVLGELSHADLGSTLGAVTGSLGGATSGAGGALGPVTGLLGDASGGGPLGTVAALVGDVTGASGTGHAVASVALGPQTASSGLGIDVLSNVGGQAELIGTHTGTAAAPSPIVAGVNLLSDASLHFPSPSSDCGDALSGVLQHVGGAASPAAPAVQAHAGIDLGIAHVELPVAATHADPLASLAHVIPHV